MSNLARGMASYYDQALALFNAGNNHQAKELCLVIVNHAWSPRLTKALAWQLLSEMPDWGYQSRKWALTNAEAVIRQFTEDNPEDAKLKQDLLAHNSERLVRLEQAKSEGRVVKSEGRGVSASISDDQSNISEATHSAKGSGSGSGSGGSESDLLARLPYPPPEIGAVGDDAKALEGSGEPSFGQ